MPKSKPRSKLNTPQQPAQLVTLINQYNQLPEQDNIKRLFYLQKINQLARYYPSSYDLITWKNQQGAQGLEEHLQHYGIHRDASPLLQSIEFAAAVKRLAIKIPVENPQQDLYAAMRARDALLQSEPNDEVLKNYIQSNLSINANYENNPSLQEKIERSIHLLSLSYAKLESEQMLQMIKKEYQEYQQSVLGKPEGNNKNFYFNIIVSSDQYKKDEDNQVLGALVNDDYFSKKGINKPDDKAPTKLLAFNEFGSKAPQIEGLVIRLEDRKDLGEEQALQSDKVSEYFSQDYATVMIKVDEVDVNGQPVYKPFVISELASNDLEHYAEKLQNTESSQHPGLITRIFSQISDFLKKLTDSGHYHPDIKLSNFLITGDRVFVADRKAIIATKNPVITECSTTVAYAPPEFLKHMRINDEETGMTYKDSALDATVEMPSFMSYQLGEALKEFVLLGKMVKGPANEVKNIAALVSKLMCDEPEERLPIACFQTLIQHLSLDPEEFAELQQTVIDDYETVIPLDKPPVEPDIKDDAETIMEVTKIGISLQTLQRQMKERIKVMRGADKIVEQQDEASKQKGP